MKLKNFLFGLLIACLAPVSVQADTANVMDDISVPISSNMTVSSSYVPSAFGILPSLSVSPMSAVLLRFDIENIFPYDYPLANLRLFVKQVVKPGQVQACLMLPPNLLDDPTKPWNEKAPLNLTSAIIIPYCSEPKNINATDMLEYINIDVSELVFYYYMMIYDSATNPASIDSANRATALQKALSDIKTKQMGMPPIELAVISATNVEKPTGTGISTTNGTITSAPASVVFLSKESMQEPPTLEINTLGPSCPPFCGQ